MAEERTRRSPRSSGMAEGVAAAVRRRQRERGPRVLLYDAAGHSRAIAPSAPGYDELLAAADQMVQEVEAAARATSGGTFRERAAARRKRAEGEDGEP
jgi:hypothetical protein